MHSFLRRFSNFLRPLNLVAPPVPSRLRSSSSSFLQPARFRRDYWTVRTPSSRSICSGGIFVPPAGVGSREGGVLPVIGAMDVAGEESAPAKRFWRKFAAEAAFAMYSPFLVGLASGTLEKEAFRSYISQDAHFLRVFARAYEMAEEYADDDDAKGLIGELRDAALDELKMHNSYAEAWGVDLVKENVPSPETIEYTDFLLATAAGKVEGEKVPSKIATPFEKTKIAAYTVGAMTPCMRLYAYLGVEFQKLLGHEDHEHPFRKWIENYASESFQTSALKVEELLERLSVSLIGAELEVIEKLYRHAMKLEIQFFDAQHLSRRYLVPLYSILDPEKERFIIFSDFDLTCTTIDSSAILAEIAILTAPKVESVEPENPNPRISSSQLRKSWDALSRQYTDEYEQYIEDIVLDQEGDTIPYAYEKLHKALEHLSEFEKSANLRVIESEVLKGLNLEDIKRAGERLKLQDGCVKFFQKAIQKKEELNPDIHILSYCWCGDLIRSAFKSGGLEDLNIHANELAYDGIVSTGKISRKVESPINKLDVFSGVLNNCGKERHLSIYIGDSVGDLLCLLQADVGIVVGSSASLRRVGKRFGISFLPLFSEVVQRQKEFVEDSNMKWPKGVLYTVSSWTEIHAFILGSSS